MNKHQTPAPGIFFGNYPEKPNPKGTFFSKLEKKIMVPFVLFNQKNSKQYAPFITQVTAHEEKLYNTLDLNITARIRELRELLTMHGLTEALVAEVFAVISYVSKQELGIKPYHTQLIAARIMLDGSLAEMATGEGKTLAAAISAATAAMAGIPVHLITSNDYLVSRDSESLLPLYHALGLTVGAITQPLNDSERKTAYACNITYITAKELVFDYLKDRTSGGHSPSSLHQRAASLSGKTSNTLLRGLCMAIIDEADSIMIDEARTPLILSQSMQNNDEYNHQKQALSLALTLKKESDFSLDRQNLLVELTALGGKKIKNATRALSGVWQNSLLREEIICQALAAHFLYQRDHHYLVKDGKVHIIDEITGRIAPGRVWSHGLHQLIEIKEGCKPSSELMTLAQITYQRFFPRYLKLGGMSGTLNESRTEFFSIYDLRIIKVPLKQASQRITLPTIIYPNKEILRHAVVDRVIKIQKNGQPILIGTDSVADSDALSTMLVKAQLSHKVLNARQDQQEADIIAKAGQKNQITISTNMAGRGTDIAVDKDVAALGGLHLISCQHNASRRIDRQLQGRCARHGQPGSAEMLISLDNPLIKKIIPSWISAFAKNKGISRPKWLVSIILRLPQWIEESNQFKMRFQMMKRDARIERETFIPD